MGLDMYLEARVSAYRPFAENEAVTAERNVLVEAAEKVGLPNAGNIDCVTISREAAYWRKANQIHKWFVQNVQNGEDNCGHYYVERAQLKALRDLSADVLKKRTARYAKVELPPESGFFFGTDDIDDWYWYSVEATVAQLDRCLALPENVEFQYHSSW